MLKSNRMPPLRELQSSAIAELIECAQAGYGSVISISGTMGAGKTSLLRDICDDVRSRDFTFLQLFGNFPERENGFEAARALLGSAPLTRAAARPGNESAPTDIAEAIRAIENWKPGDSTSTSVVSRQIDDIICFLSRDMPLVIGVDDCQWLDSPSLKWLTEFSWRIRQMPVILVVVVGSGEVCVDPEQLDELISNAVHEFHPDPLRPSEVATILENSLGIPGDPEFIRACITGTCGNPRLMTALAAHLAERQIVPDAENAPWVSTLELAGLAPALRARLRRVTKHAHAVAQVVTVLDTSATIDRVAAMTGVTPSVISGTVNALQRMGVLDVERQSVTIVHPLIESLLRQQLTYSALQELHCQAARTIALTGGNPKDVAEHLLASAPVAEPWALAALMAAAEHVLTDGDPRSAVAYLRRALQEPSTDSDRFKVLGRLGEAEARIDIKEAMANLSQVVAASSCAEVRARAGQQLADLLGILGDEVTLERRAGSLRSLSAGTILPMHTTAALFELQKQGEQAVAAALGRRVQIGDDSDPAALKQFMTTYAATADADSSVSIAFTSHCRNRTFAVALADRVVTSPLADVDQFLAHLRGNQTLIHGGRLDTAFTHCDRLITMATAWQHLPALSAAYGQRADIWFRRGRLHEAVDDARTGLKLLEDSQADPRAGTVMMLRARLIHALVELGSLAEAMDVLEAGGWAIDLPPDPDFPSPALLFARAQLLVSVGRTQEGIRELLTLGDRLTDWKIANPALIPWRSSVAIAMHRTGHQKKALTHAAEEVRLAREWGAPGPLGRALRIYGSILPRRAGLATCKEATDLLADSDWSLEFAWSLIEYGSALHSSHRDVEARKFLKQAHRIGLDIGSPILVDRAKTDYGIVGGRLGKNSSKASVLTPAEQRVALQAAAKQTNREIAVALFVSRRVVEIHLTRAYRKLGISGRNELPDALRTIGVTPAES